jgi:hypothetical protein
MSNEEENNNADDDKLYSQAFPTLKVNRTNVKKSTKLTIPQI